MTEVVQNTRKPGHAHGGLSENPQIARPLIGQRQRKFKTPRDLKNADTCINRWFAVMAGELTSPKHATGIPWKVPNFIISVKDNKIKMA